VAESFLNFGVVARREAEQRAELAAAPEVEDDRFKVPRIVGEAP